MLDLSDLNISDDELDNNDYNYGGVKKMSGIEDFETFKKQFNLKDILDKLVIKREFFIP